jgi:hypothetical protein
VKVLVGWGPVTDFCEYGECSVFIKVRKYLIICINRKFSRKVLELVGCGDERIDRVN